MRACSSISKMGLTTHVSLWRESCTTAHRSWDKTTPNAKQQQGKEKHSKFMWVEGANGRPGDPVKKYLLQSIQCLPMAEGKDNAGAAVRFCSRQVCTPTLTQQTQRKPRPGLLIPPTAQPWAWHNPSLPANRFYMSRGEGACGLCEHCAILTL